MKTCLDCLYSNSGDKAIDLWLYCSEPENGIIRCGKHGCLLVDEANGISDTEPCDNFRDAEEHRRLFEPEKVSETPF